MSALALASPARRPAEFITVGAAAARLNVSRQTVHRLIGQGRLTARRVSCWSYVSSADVARLRDSAVRPAVAE